MTTVERARLSEAGRDVGTMSCTGCLVVEHGLRRRPRPQAKDSLDKVRGHSGGHDPADFEGEPFSSGSSRSIPTPDPKCSSRRIMDGTISYRAVFVRRRRGHAAAVARGSYRG